MTAALLGPADDDPIFPMQSFVPMGLPVSPRPDEGLLARAEGSETRTPPTLGALPVRTPVKERDLERPPSYHGTLTRLASVEAEDVPSLNQRVSGYI